MRESERLWMEAKRCDAMGFHKDAADFRRFGNGARSRERMRGWFGVAIFVVAVFPVARWWFTL